MIRSSAKIQLMPRVSIVRSMSRLHWSPIQFENGILERKSKYECITYSIHLIFQNSLKNGTPRLSWKGKFMREITLTMLKSWYPCRFLFKLWYYDTCNFSTNYQKVGGIGKWWWFEMSWNKIVERAEYSTDYNTVHVLYVIKATWPDCHSKTRWRSPMGLERDRGTRGSQVLEMHRERETSNDHLVTARHTPTKTAGLHKPNSKNARLSLRFAEGLD